MSRENFSDGGYFSLRGNASEIDFCQKEADKAFKGNKSAYIRHLIQEAMNASEAKPEKTSTKQEDLASMVKQILLSMSREEREQALQATSSQMSKDKKESIIHPPTPKETLINEEENQKIKEIAFFDFG